MLLVQQEGQHDDSGRNAATKCPFLTPLMLGTPQKACRLLPFFFTLKCIKFSAPKRHQLMHQLRRRNCDGVGDGSASIQFVAKPAPKSAPFHAPRMTPSLVPYLATVFIPLLGQLSNAIARPVAGLITTEKYPYQYPRYRSDV